MTHDAATKAADAVRAAYEGKQSLLDWLRIRMFDLKTRATRDSNNGFEQLAKLHEAKRDAFNEVLELLTRNSNAYLATVAADDEPIDEMWLWSLGFEGYSGELQWLAAGCRRSIELRVSDGKLFLFGNLLDVRYKTRGQLRALCRALNIALPIAGETQS